MSEPRHRNIVAAFAGIPTSDGAGVKLERVIGQQGLPDLDPFLLFDAFGSDDPDAYIAGFPDHPHRGFETVTYMLEGRMRHRDSRGNQGLLTAGSVQWMTAGSGLVHSEMPEQEEGRMAGFQLWVNLPARDKMTAPRYQDIAPDKIPVVHPSDGVEVRVIAGELDGATGAVNGIATAPIYMDIAVQAGAQIEIPLPEGHSGFAYVFDGTDASVAGERLGRSELAVLSKGDSVRVAGRDAAARVLLVAGKALQEPVARYGPFVMNTPEQIHEAIAAFRAGEV